MKKIKMKYLFYMVLCCVSFSISAQELDVSALHAEPPGVPDARAGDADTQDIPVNLSTDVPADDVSTDASADVSSDVSTPHTEPSGASDARAGAPNTQRDSRIIYGTVFADDKNVTPEMLKNFDREKDPLKHHTVFLTKPTPYPDGKYFEPFPVIYKTVPNANGFLSQEDGTVAARFTSDEEGYFLLYDVPEGTYSVFAEDQSTGRIGEGTGELVYKDDRAYLMVFLDDPPDPDDEAPPSPPFNPMPAMGGGGFPIGLLGLLGLFGLSGDTPSPVSPSMP